MIDHGAILLACRAKLDTLSVATVTGSIEATATGYVRASGSFIADGFQAGMEITGTDFAVSANNAPKTITEVAATILTCSGNAVEAAGTRTLSVGVPEGVASENVAFTPVMGEPYFAESYLPGPMFQATIGDEGELEARPAYVLRVHLPIKTGVLGAWGYVNAILALFKPGTSLAVTDHTVWVRRDTAPFATQLQVIESYAVVNVTVPLRVRVLNV